MSRQLDLFLDGKLAGDLTQDRNGLIGFSYAESYLAAPKPTPLSLSMPLSTDRQRPKSVRAFMENLLPDNESVRRSWASRYGVNPNNPVALLEHVGRDAPGAVQVMPKGESPSDAQPRSDDIEWLSGEDFRTIVRDLDEHGEDWDTGRYAGRWSLAGGQAKAALYRDPETGQWGVPRDSTPTTHIVKPPLPSHRDHHINEVLCLKAAEHIGLSVTDIEAIDHGDCRAIVVGRYDRRPDRHGTIRRLHQEDLCQALSVGPQQKYQSDGGPGISDAADLFVSLDRRDRDYSRRAFFDAVGFNVLIGATDAHAKNYSVLLSGSRARLAPLYDIGSAAPYPQRIGLRSAMPVGRESRMAAIGRRQWHRAAQRLGLDPEASAESVERMRRGIPEAFEKALDELPESSRTAAHRMAEQIVAHAQRRWHPGAREPSSGIYPASVPGGGDGHGQSPTSSLAPDAAELASEDDTMSRRIPSGTVDAGRCGSTNTVSGKPCRRRVGDGSCPHHG